MIVGRSSLGHIVGGCATLAALALARIAGLRLLIEGLDERTGAHRDGRGGRDGAAAGDGGVPGAAAASDLCTCSDLFQQDIVRTYSIDIDPTEWTSVMGEFNELATLTATGNDFVVRHPVVFHMGSETVSDATLKLHGQSSWAQTAMLDGSRAKIQFDISFHQNDPNGKFHGIEKLVFDMPRSDWTFMHDRLAHAWLRQVGIASGCAASARVEINGSYYGLFVAEENTNKRVIAQFFPGQRQRRALEGGQSSRRRPVGAQLRTGSWRSAGGGLPAFRRSSTCSRRSSSGRARRCSTTPTAPTAATTTSTSTIRARRASSTCPTTRTPRSSG